MNETVPFGVAEHPAVAPSSEKLLQVCSLICASAFTLIGMVMLVTALASSAGGFLKGLEVFLSVGMLVAAFLLWRTVVTREYRSSGVGLLSGEIALACAFVYLGVAMPIFQQGLSSAKVASVQFLIVLATLVFGSGQLALSGFSKQNRPLGQVTFPAMVRDGVILLTGTVLMAISLGMLPTAAIKPPHWSWISFLGITIPGMLLLVVREGLKEHFETWHGPMRLPGLLITETMLVLGLTLMFYGSYANLTLGANSYQIAFKGNPAGLALWLVAVFLLLVGRGVFKLLFSHGENWMSYRVMSKLFYVVAAILFVYGERSLITGKAPTFAIGTAAPIVALFLLGALLVLVIARPANQKVSAGAAAHQEATEEEVRTA